MPLLDEEYRRRIEEWVETGTAWYPSADELYAALRGTPYEAPRRIIREEWREHIASQGYVPLINRMSDEDYIPRRWLGTTYADYLDNYAIKVKISGPDSLTGAIKEHFITLEYTEGYQVGVFRQDASDYVYLYGFELSPGACTVEIARVLHKRGRAY
jgi:hypothetical protein